MWNPDTTLVTKELLRLVQELSCGKPTIRVNKEKIEI